MAKLTELRKRKELAPLVIKEGKDLLLKLKGEAGVKERKEIKRGKKEGGHSMARAMQVQAQVCGVEGAIACEVQTTLEEVPVQSKWTSPTPF